MPPEYAGDLSDSAFDFERVVWPAVGRLACGGGEIFCMEQAPAAIARAFDQHAGIDYVQLHPTVGLRGISSRVQWIDEGGAPYQTFTIRTARDFGTKTEYAKLEAALDSTRGAFFPHLFIQAYVATPRREGRLLSAAVAETRDIIRWLQNHPERLEESLTQRRGRSSRFVYVAWDELIDVGAKVIVVPSGEMPLAPIVDEPVQIPLTGVPAPPRKLRQLSLVFEDDEPVARLLDATPNTWRKQSC